MDQCLRIPEMVDIIFANFACEDEPSPYDFKSNEAWRSLAKLARTCKAFQEPALQVLWSRLFSLDPLLKTLPEDVVRHDGHKWLLLRGIYPQDLRKLTTYAARVKHLECSDIRLSSYTPLMNSLLLCFLHRPLMPNLRHLKWSTACTEGQTFIPSFLGPHLRSMFLIVSLNAEKNPSTFTAITSCCPELRSLHISAFRAPKFHAERPEAGFWLLVDGLAKLEDTKIMFSLDATATQKLAAHSSLLDIDCCLNPSLLLGVSNPHPFSSIKHMTLRSPRCEHGLGDFLVNWTNTHLSSLVLIDLNARLEDIRALLSAMGNAPALIHLAKLEIGCSPPKYDALHWDHAADGLCGPLVLADIAPLRALGGLRAFALEYRRFALTDEFLEWAGGAWPRLRRLSLRPCGPIPVSQSTSITIAGLAPILICCPDLLTLELLLDGTSSPPFDEDAPPPAHVNRSFRELNVAFSSIRDPAPIAAFLSSVAPNVVVKTGALRDVEDVSETTLMRYAARWAQVSTMVEWFGKVRRQERRRDYTV